VACKEVLCGKLAESKGACMAVFFTWPLKSI